MPKEEQAPAQHVLDVRGDVVDVLDADVRLSESSPRRRFRVRCPRQEEGGPALVRYLLDNAVFQLRAESEPYAARMDLRMVGDLVGRDKADAEAADVFPA